MSGTPTRFASADQTLWKERSLEIINQISELLEDGREYETIHRICAHWRQQTARLCEPSNPYSHEYGIIRGPSERRGVSETVGFSYTCWEHIEKAVFKRVENLIHAETFEGYDAQKDYDNPVPTNKWNIQYHTHNPSNISISYEIDHDGKAGLILEYPMYTHESNKKNLELTDYYLNNCLYKQDKDSLLLNVGRLVHIMAQSLRTYRGNAAITQWMATAIFKFHGYKVDQLVKEGFPTTKDGLSFDWAALLTPNQERYATEFSSIMNEHLASASKADRALSVIELAPIKWEVPTFKPKTAKEIDSNTQSVLHDHISIEEYLELEAPARAFLSGLILRENPELIQRAFADGTLSIDILNWMQSEDLFNLTHLHQYELSLINDIRRLPDYRGQNLRSLFETIGKEKLLVILKYKNGINEAVRKHASLEEIMGFTPDEIKKHFESYTSTSNFINNITQAPKNSHVLLDPYKPSAPDKKPSL